MRQGRVGWSYSKLVKGVFLNIHKIIRLLHNSKDIELTQHILEFGNIHLENK